MSGAVLLQGASAVGGSCPVLKCWINKQRCFHSSLCHYVLWPCIKASRVFTQRHEDMSVDTVAGGPVSSLSWCHHWRVGCLTEGMKKGPPTIFIHLKLHVNNKKMKYSGIHFDATRHWLCSCRFAAQRQSCMLTMLSPVATLAIITCCCTALSWVRMKRCIAHSDILNLINTGPSGAKGALWWTHFIVLATIFTKSSF